MEGTKNCLSMISAETPEIMGQNVIIPKHGSNRTIDWVTSGIFEEDGTLIEYQSVGHDVTDIRETREQLALSEMRHRQAVDIAGLGYWVWDERENCLDYCSEQAASIQ